MKQISKLNLEKIFHNTIVKHNDNCFCNLNGKCINCDSKETIIELWKKIEKEFDEIKNE